MRLYKLSNTDVTLLEEELAKLKELVINLQKILDDENELKRVMKDDLRAKGY